MYDMYIMYKAWRGRSLYFVSHLNFGEVSRAFICIDVYKYQIEWSQLRAYRHPTSPMNTWAVTNAPVSQRMTLISTDMPGRTHCWLWRQEGWPLPSKTLGKPGLSTELFTGHKWACNLSYCPATPYILYIYIYRYTYISLWTQVPS